MRRRLFLLLGFCLGLMLVQNVMGAPIKEVRVQVRGDGIVDEQGALAFISSKAGDTFSRPAVGRDVKALQQSGRYARVDVEIDSVPGGVNVTFLVEGKARIRRLEISGADALGNRKVRELLELGVGDMVDDATLAVQAQKVREHYQKKYYPNAKITWTISPSGEAGMVNVQVRVDEGKRTRVRKIRFDGNRHIPARQLKKVMTQKEVNWLSWITGTGTYNPDDLETDMESVRKAYLDQGYLDVAVGTPDIQLPRPKRMRIEIPVEEGRQYRIRRVTLDGVKIFDAAAVERQITLKEGDVASMAAIENAAQAVRDYYGDRGYIRTTVRYELDVNAQGGVADVAFTVTEGKLAYIRNISIRGNSITKDKVIRRELAVYPGGEFSEVRVRTSERRLRNLGYFDYVNSMPESTPEADQFDLAFEVEERKTGQFMVGAGFSSVDALIGFVELSQGNFDLFGWPRFSGGGQKLRLRSQFGTKRTDYEVSFVEPWFLNRRLSLGVDFFQHESRYFSSEYDQRNTGGSVSLGRPLGVNNRVNLTYGLEEIKVFNVASNASELIRQEEGTRTKSAVTLELVHDTRDSFFVPTRGNRSSISGTLAGGPFAGDTDLYSLQARTSQYWPLWFDHVFNIRGWAAVVEEYGDADRVPIFDRFFLGGARTIRGFRYRDVGPKDETGEPIGGRSSFFASAEYTIPIAEKVRLAGFYDTGMVWAEAYEFDMGNLNSSFGFGVRFDFPGFPIQLDYSWPTQTDEFNDRPSGRFSFWLGYTY